MASDTPANTTDNLALMMPSAMKKTLSEEMPRAEQTDHADDDQVQSDDEIEQARHQQDENASDQGQQRAQSDVKIHAFSRKS
jgi:hypothetical protein